MSIQLKKEIKLFFEANPSPLIIVSQDSKILDFNHQLLILLQYEIPPTALNQLSDLFSVELENDLWWFDYFWESGVFRDIEAKIYNQKQDIVEVLVSGSKINLDNHQLLLISLQDVSQLRRNQLALYEARLAAEHANQGKTQFLSYITHELKTPLNSIMGFSQLLLRRSSAQVDFEKDQDKIQKIYTSGNHLLSLINDLLDISKLELGEFDIALLPVNLTAVLKESIASLQSLFSQKNITLTEHFNAENMLVLSDNMRLKQIFLNILSNAIKYTAENGQVDIYLKVIEPNMLQVCIEDNGEGIAQDQLTELFKPFKRLTSDLSAIEGTGLGLTIARHLSKMMKAKIYAKSELTKGSRFFFEIPIHKQY